MSDHPQLGTLSRKEAVIIVARLLHKWSNDGIPLIAGWNTTCIHDTLCSANVLLDSGLLDCDCAGCATFGTGPKYLALRLAELQGKDGATRATLRSDVGWYLRWLDGEHCPSGCPCAGNVAELEACTDVRGYPTEPAYAAEIELRVARILAAQGERGPQ